MPPDVIPLLTLNTPLVWFSGTPFAHNSNSLLVPILQAPASSASSDTDSDASAGVVFAYAERGGERLCGRQFVECRDRFPDLDNRALPGLAALTYFPTTMRTSPFIRGV